MQQREADSFNALLNINLSIPPPPLPSSSQQPQSSTLQAQLRGIAPLTAGCLDPEKQKLVSNLLKSRFRSAGDMDVTKELSAAQEDERRKQLDVSIFPYFRLFSDLDSAQT